MSNNSIKILLITPAYWPAVDYGGPIQSVSLLAKEIKNLGHEVNVFTLAYGLSENKFQQRTVNEVRVSYFKYFKFWNWFVPRLAFIKELVKCKNNFDIFHINLIWDPISWISGFILSFLGKKIIISPRGTIEEGLIQKRRKLLKKIVYFLIIRFIFNKASGFHFTSQKEKDEFFKFTKINKPYIILPNLFEYQEFQKSANSGLLGKFNLKNKKYILYFGRINWKKRLELLIDAFSEINKNFKDIYLALIGAADEDYFEKLKQKIKDLGLENKVILVGETISGDLKIALYQNSYCFVLPSISENFGYVVLEALASKVPVIISEGVGLKELIEEYNAGLIFGGENYEKFKNDLVNKIKLILENKELVKDLVKNGEVLFNNEFDNKILAQKMLKFYYEILEK